MRISKLALSLYVALIFLSGVAVGIFSYRLYAVTTVAARDPNEFRKRYTNELQTRLHLNQDQLAKLNSVFDETRARVDDLDRKRRQDMRPEMDAIRAEQRDKVRAMLDPAQRTEYEKILQEHAEARKKRQAEQQLKQQGQPAAAPAH